jgi:hypothetical protein
VIAPVKAPGDDEADPAAEDDPEAEEEEDEPDLKKGNKPLQ